MIEDGSYNAKPMKIGVVPTLNRSYGGSFQYALAILDAVVSLSRAKHSRNTFVWFVSPDDRKVVRSLDNFGGMLTVVYGSIFDKIFTLGKAQINNKFIRALVRSLRPQFNVSTSGAAQKTRRSAALANALRRHEIDWVLYTSPDENSYRTGVPFVMPVFDLQHRQQPEFPEVSADGNWEELENLYRNSTRQATLILADSEIGKEDIIASYESEGITPDCVKVLPYVFAPYLSAEVTASELARIRAKYTLPERYLFYPAQLWAHKNHVRIVRAIGWLKDTKGLVIEIVFCGASSGALRTKVLEEMMSEANRLGIDKQIHYLGYVPDDAMSALYSGAVGLVMPTFFGPTNIPIVEAWNFGCPVLTSDIRGIREQVGDAGLLVEPRSVEAIANGMEHLWQDSQLRAQLSRRGAQRLAAYNREHFCAKLAEILSEANHRVALQREEELATMSAKHSGWNM